MDRHPAGTGIFTSDGRLEAQVVEREARRMRALYVAALLRGAAARVRGWFAERAAHGIHRNARPSPG